MNISGLAHSISSPYTAQAVAPKQPVVDDAPVDGEKNYKTPDGVFNDFPDRAGYDPDFLGVHVPLPTLNPELRKKAAPLLSDPSQIELKYTHFSVVQHKDRGAPIMAVVNIDGAQYQELDRKGDWVKDGRIAPEQQTGNEAYFKNDYDRGHLVRRKDVQWGPEAAKAAKDSFVYTNAALQHADLNQRTWLDIENNVFWGAVTQKDKKTVMSGPIFHESDPKFDNGGQMKEPTQIPQAFWKVQFWKDDIKGLQAQAFVASQKDLIGKPPSRIPYESMTPTQMKTYVVSMDKLEELTGLDFVDIPEGDRIESDAKAIKDSGIDLDPRPWLKKDKEKTEKPIVSDENLAPAAG